MPWNGDSFSEAAEPSLVHYNKNQKHSPSLSKKSGILDLAGTTVPVPVLTLVVDK